MARQLTPERFAASLRALGVTPDTRLAVAVSGGVDSIALAHLALQSHAQEQLVFLTVDHRLRETSTREAQHVADTLHSWGAPCEILTWQDASGGSGVQARARDARYALLRDAAHKHACNGVLLGHHADDQTETFWMRLADGSGLTGLAGMAAVREDNDMRWLRPLLDATRADINAYAQQHALPVIEDPSNGNPQFLRVRLRGFADALAAEGLTPQRLARTVSKLRDAEQALAQVADQLWQQRVHVHPAGAICLDVRDFAQCPRDLRRRLIQRALMTLSPSLYPAAYENVVHMADQLASGQFTATTLSGCILRQVRETLWVMREPAAVAPPQMMDEKSGDALVWDRRFAVSGLKTLSGQGLILAALSEEGWLQITREHKELWPVDWIGVPMELRAGLPALWQGGKPVAIPQLSWQRGDFNLSQLKILPALIV